MNDEELEKMYIDLIQPKNLVEYFIDDEDFREWVQMGTADEMRWALKAFERDELYRYCKIIKEEIDLLDQHNI